MVQFGVNTLVFTIQPQTCDVFEFYASDTGGAVTLLADGGRYEWVM